MSRIRQLVAFWTTALVLVWFGFGSYLLSVQAATTMTDAYDQPTSLKVSTAANHKLVLTTANGLPEAAYFTITFPSQFDLSTITEDDVDIADDGVDLTTAVDCSGSEQARITISGNNLNLLICIGDGGAIAAGSVMTFEIGTNTSYSGNGTNQIVNPTGLGTYFVNVISATESASIPIPIISDDDSGVSATVVSSGGGDGGTPPTPPTKSVTVTQPNGGETLTKASTYLIGWSSTGTISYANLYWSADNGATYSAIVNNIVNSGTYSWTVPNVDTAQALIKVEGTDLATILATDVSNNVFTIGTPVLPPVCGNGIVESGEECDDGNIIDSDGCSAICKIETPPVPVCGDGIVNGAEQCDDGNILDGDGCSAICRTEIPPVPICGDGIVSGNEQCDDGNVASGDGCSSACRSEEVPPVIEPEPEPEVPPVTEPEVPPVTEPGEEEPPVTGRDIATEIYTGDGQIILPAVDSVYSILPGTTGAVQVYIGDAENLSSRILTYAQNEYPLTDIGNGYFETQLPFSSNEEVITVTVEYSDGSTLTESLITRPSSFGMIYEIVDGVRTPVAGAVVIVYEEIGGARTQWSGGASGQGNPIITTQNGVVGWYVPNGTYVVTAGKSNYEDSEITLSVRNSILNPFIQLTRIEEIVPPIIEEEGTMETVSEAISDVINIVSATIENIRQSPEVQTTATVATPVAATAAVASTVVLASSFNLLSFLRYFFTAPFLFFTRRRRKQFGLVYNAYTKIPIDLAVVRLLNAQGKLVRTGITDQAGRYFFKVDAGEYTVQVTKQGFLFPSIYLQGKNVDGKFVDVFTQGLLKVTDKNTLVTLNIPLDPLTAPEHDTLRRLSQRRFLRVLQRLISFTGVLLALFVLIILPTIINSILFAAQIFVLIATLYLIRPKRKKGWGIVSDKSDRKPLKDAVVRLYEPVYNKLLESTLTDGQGRYAFLAGPNQYFTTYEKAGFEKQEVRPIDLSQKEEPELISVDVSLNKPPLNDV